MDIQDISQDLLIKSSQGDLAACEEIYKAAAGFVYNVALRIVGNRDDAQEVIQETFLKIFENLKEFKFQSSFKTWTYRITVNTALNYRKKAVNDASRRVELGENEDIEAMVKHPADQDLDAKSNEEYVNQLLDKLNPDQRTCVVLRDLQGLSYEEISQTLGININTVRSRLKRARSTLVELCKERW